MLAATGAIGALPARAGNQADPGYGPGLPSSKRLKMAFVLYPDMTLLDLIGPQQTLNFLPNVESHLVYVDKRTIVTDSGVHIVPTTTYSACPDDLDVLLVPGAGKGTIGALQDPALMAFVAERGKTARYVTSVCTGSLILGAAGLLNGYRASSHWLVRDLLPVFGATAVNQRVVHDRNRVTGGGVTAGIDFGLALAAILRGEQTAKMAQLALEYDPAPPFDAGSPEKAGEELVNLVRKKAVFAQELHDIYGNGKLPTSR
ncbi:DJ-1/PfpI family protein [Paraherbaspirillum soli]|uniref:DJ-1/PfpI family protein n=1 Tax=Paraherbaspirillum soli TaxID=631222 RepID=A0ABW0MD55_9BURK